MKGRRVGGSAYTKLQPVLERAASEGLVLWEEPHDRPVPVGRMAARVRFVPTFVHRALTYRTTAESCGLCPGDRSENVIGPADVPPPWSPSFHRFREVFDLRLNNFPYLKHQVLACLRVHAPTLTSTQLGAFVAFLPESGFRGGAMQVLGSGATVPDHAHLSLFAEPLPVFDLEREEVGSIGDVLVRTCVGYPGCVLVFDQGDVASRCEAVVRVLDRLAERRMTFNLLVDPDGAVYVVARTRERSPTARRKIGFTAVAGLYTGYVGQAPTPDAAGLRRAILDDCDAVTALTYAAALRETVWQASPGALLGLLEDSDVTAATPARSRSQPVRVE